LFLKNQEMQVIVAFFLFFTSIMVFIYELKFWNIHGLLVIVALFGCLSSCFILIHTFMKRKSKCLLVCAADGPSEVIRLMLVHSDDVQYQWQGSAALYHIMLVNTQSCEESLLSFYNLGAWDRLYHSVTIFPESKEATSWGFAALSLLSALPEVKAQVECEDNIASLLQALKKCLAAGKLCETTLDSKGAMEYMNAQKRGCMLLGQLADGSLKLQTSIVDEGGIEFIIDSMKWYRKHSHIQQWGIWALLQLTFEHPANNGYLLRKGGIEIILDAMKNHNTAADIHGQGLGLILCALQRKDDSDVPLIFRVAWSSGLKQVAERCLLRFQDNEHIVNASNQILAICKKATVAMKHPNSKCSHSNTTSKSKQNEKSSV